MRRRERVAELRGAVDRHPGGDLGREAAGGLHVDHALAERLHDPPPADVRARRDRQPRGDDHPVWDVEVRQVPGLEERQRDHAHRLLRIVGAVRERDPGARGELAEPERPVRHPGVHPDEQPVDRQQQEERPGEGDRRRGDCRDRDAVHEPMPLDAFEARLGDRGTDEPADQRVRRARGQPGPPGDQVPDDRSNQCGQDRLLVGEARVDDSLADGLGDRSGDERAGQVRDRSDQDRQPR